jgi:hypothetical protein
MSYEDLQMKEGDLRWIVHGKALHFADEARRSSAHAQRVVRCVQADQ